MVGAFYPTHQGASSAATELACSASPTRRAKFIPYSGGAQRERAVRPFEGGPAFAAEMLTDGWTVRQLSPEELAERVRIGLRREVDELIERAKQSKARAQELLGSKFAARHQADARRDLMKAEALLEDIGDIGADARCA